MYTQSNVTVMVSDLKRALEFYRDALGFEHAKDFGSHWQELKAPGLTIGLHPGPAERPSGRGMSIGLRVEDLDEAKKRLTRSGVRFEDGPQDQGSRIAYFSDPDGNPLYLIELKWG